MKQFFKMAFAAAFGLFIASMVMSILSFFILIGVLASSGSSFTAKDNSILNLSLEGVLKERTVENPFSQLLGDATQELSLEDIVSSIKKAKSSPYIKGIYITGNGLGGSLASLEEIRNTLADFKESGKFIISYSDYYSQGNYFISTISDKVMLNPQGNIDLRGLSSSTLFFKDALEKLGVKMQIFKVGTFKSYTETFSEKNMSEANKEQMTSSLSSMWKILSQEIAQSRSITQQKIAEMADQGVFMQEASFYIDNRLADTLVYQSEAERYLKKRLNLEEDVDLNFVSIGQINQIPAVEKEEKDKIAVLYAYGAIQQKSNNLKNEGIDAQEIIQEIEKISKNKDIKALVLRVNSPGGSGYDSEQIWKAIVDLKTKMPVIVSMGDFAASGGYYISTPADVIVAQPTTLTGSIGVFGMIPDGEGLLNKLGVSQDGVKTHRFGDLNTLGMRPMREDEKQLMQQHIEYFYRHFVERCVTGRSMTTDAIEKVAQGRVWTGAQAKEIGLVDELGGLDKAISIAAMKAKIEKYSIEKYPSQPGFAEQLLSGFTQTVQTKWMQNQLGEMYIYYQHWQEIQNLSPIQARLPLILNIN